jgi:hypothetical protein
VCYLSSLALGPLAINLSGLHWMCSSSIRSYKQEYSAHEKDEKDKRAGKEMRKRAKRREET